MRTRTKKIILGVSLLIAGTGLLVGGVFLTPLLAPGGAFFAGGVALLQSLPENEPRANPVALPPTQVPIPTSTPGMHWHVHREVYDADMNREQPNRLVPNP